MLINDNSPGDDNDASQHSVYSCGSGPALGHPDLSKKLGLGVVDELSEINIEDVSMNVQVAKDPLIISNLEERAIVGISAGILGIQQLC